MKIPWKMICTFISSFVNTGIIWARSSSTFEILNLFLLSHWCLQWILQNFRGTHSRQQAYKKLCKWCLRELKLSNRAYLPSHWSWITIHHRWRWLQKLNNYFHWYYNFGGQHEGLNKFGEEIESIIHWSSLTSTWTNLLIDSPKVWRTTRSTLLSGRMSSRTFGSPLSPPLELNSSLQF